MGTKTRAQYAEELINNKLLHEIVDTRVKELYEEWVLFEENEYGHSETQRLTAKVYKDFKVTVMTIAQNELTKAEEDNSIVVAGGAS